jgi:hypothetical protein
MARNFGKIVPGFYNNPKVRRLSEDAQHLLCYLFTAPDCTAAGTYSLSMATICDHKQWDEKRVRSALQELSKKPFALWDQDSRVLYLPGWFGHNGVDAPRLAIHIANALMQLPDCPYKQRAIDDLRAVGKYLDIINGIVGEWTYKPDNDIDGQDTLPLMVAPSAAKRANGKDASTAAAKGTRLSQDWQPDADMVEYALGKGLNHQDVERETTKFVRYWTGPDASSPVKKDWARTWANWIDKAAERLPQRSNGTNGHSNGHANGSEFEIRHVDGYKVSGRLAFKELGGASFEAVWLDRARGWRDRKFWIASWGPEPGQPRCKCPAELLSPLVE